MVLVLNKCDYYLYRYYYRYIVKCVFFFPVTGNTTMCFHFEVYPGFVDFEPYDGHESSVNENVCPVEFANNLMCFFQNLITQELENMLWQLQS